MLIRALLAFTVVSLLYAQTPAPIHTWAEAEKLEADLASHPTDLNTRIQLLRYYAASSPNPDRVKPLRRQHILWLIENNPGHSAFSDFTGVMDSAGYPLADPEGFAACSAAWDKVLAQTNLSADGFANAVYFFRIADAPRARKIAEDGLKLYPGNPRIVQRKSLLIALSIAGVKTSDQYGRGASFEQTLGPRAAADRQSTEAGDDPNLVGGVASSLLMQLVGLRPQHLEERVTDLEALIVRLYQRADKLDPTSDRWKSSLAAAYQTFANLTGIPAEKIAFLEKSIAVAPNYMSKSAALSDIAQEYLAAGKTDKAFDAAAELLGGDLDKKAWNYGNIVFNANTVLGRVAMQKGDRPEAVRRLLAAGRTPGSPQLNSFGPTDWKLAQDLLAAGERDTVLQYFDLVRGFWKMDNGRLNQWANTIREGGTPNFTGPSGFPTAQYVGRPAPEIRLKDLNGADVSLADYKGKVVLVDFWATWCAPCRAEMPEFERVHHGSAGSDVAVLTVDVDEEAELPAEYLKKEKLTFPVLLAKATDTMNRYGVHAYPTTFAIDKNGVVADVIVGGGTDNSRRLEALVAKARAGAPPPAAGSTPPPAIKTTPAATTAEDFYRDAIRQRNARDLAGASKSLDRALELRPNWLVAMSAKADVLASLNQYDEAIAAFTRLIELDPKHAASYDSRGLAYSHSGRHAQAIPDYTRAIELSPAAVPYNNRGWAYLETGRLDQALADLDRSLELNPSYTTALFNRAHLFEKRKEYAKAIADYDAVLRIDPANASAPPQRASAERKLEQ